MTQRTRPETDEPATRIATLERRVAELEARLRYDDLTGVLSKVAFFDMFPEQDRTGHFLLFLDLDDFKSVNDTFGHEVGDRLIAAIAARIAAVVGARGVVSRLAGDEFLVLLHIGREDLARDLSKRLLEQVSACKVRVGELDVARKASIGMARIAKGMTAQQAIIEADTGLRIAKTDGKGRMVTPQERCRGLALTRPSLEEVRLGLKRQEIGYHVQPIVRLSDGRIWGYEALLRWRRANGEIVGPAQFLDTMTSAYDADSRPPLGAAQATADWAVNRQGRVISFNISTAFLARVAARGMGWVHDIVGQVPPGGVIFEIVETVINEPTDAIVELVQALRRSGVRVALDDFGIGQSTLHRLQSIPVDFVKIDRHFVAAAADAPRDRNMLFHMVDLVRASGACPIVEGIETRAHLDLALALGVEYAQGFYLGRPATVEAWTGQREVELSDASGAPPSATVNALR